MSVDLAAVVTVPFSVGALLRAAAATLEDLLGVASVPVPAVTLGRKRHMGTVSTPGREPRAGELDTLMFGPRAQDGRGTTEIDIGDDLVVPFESRSGSGGWRVVFTPRRDQAGILWALALALAAARLGRGRLVDDDLRLTDPSLTDPDEFVAAARLPPANRDPAQASREFLGQFERLRGWLVP